LQNCLIAPAREAITGEHGDDDDDAEGTVSDQAGGRHEIRAGWYVTTPFCPEVVFATEQEALAYGRTEELRQELIDRVRAMSFDELRALKVNMS
jgi:hypothetical protein